MIFIDTGAFLGRFLRKDQFNSRALPMWKRLSDLRQTCHTSNFVLGETITLLGRRASYEFAAERARQLYASPQLRILRPTAEEEMSAMDFFEKFADQKFSFTDCISFALMRKHQISTAFSFDTHFERAGFQLWSGTP